jgi:hypothetical protein
METRNQILSMIQEFGNPAKNASTLKFGGWGEAGDPDVRGRVILKRILREWSRDSAVGIVTAVRAGRSGVRIPSRARNFISSPNPVAHQTSNAMGTGVISQG